MKVRVNLKRKTDNSYNIEISKGLLKKIPTDLKKKPLGNKYAIITDSHVAKIYAKKLLASLNAKKLKAKLIVFKAGEKSKTSTTSAKLCQQMLKSSFDRKSAAIALGGGVTGDLTGFTAATFMRGIPLIQAPTTLLAMVDSSVGGKTAVNLKGGKNCVGTFWQPSHVYADLDALKTLPKKELANGFSEIVKTALIADIQLFNYIEKNTQALLSAKPKETLNVVKRCVELKTKIIQRDEREEEHRKTLNLGHTTAHAIEALENYSTHSHGQAVSIGLVAAAQLSCKITGLPQKDADRIKKILQKAGLPTQIPKNLSIKKILQAMKKDKKTQNGKIQFILLEKIGKVKTKNNKVALTINKKTIKQTLKQLQTTN
ncbi:MAG: 3-dehydroquinate synthase [Candidatus Micrarchaeia archaeon]